MLLYVYKYYIYYYSKFPIPGSFLRKKKSASFDAPFYFRAPLELNVYHLPLIFCLPVSITPLALK